MSILACIVTEKGTGNSRGFGYVKFENQEDAAGAIKAADGLVKFAFIELPFFYVLLLCQ